MVQLNPRVFVVEIYDGDSSYVRGVYSTLKKAIGALSPREREDVHGWPYIEIRSWTVDSDFEEETIRWWEL